MSLMQAPVRQPQVRIPNLTVTASYAKGTWLGYVALCLYIISQAIYIPVKAIGPSWAIWPTLADLSVALMAGIYLLKFRHFGILTDANRTIYKYLLIMLASLTVLLFAPFLWGLISGNSSTSINTGLFELYHMMEFVLVFRVAAALPMTRKRVQILSHIVDGVLAVVFVGLVGTYTGVIQTSALVAHLPSDFGTAGQWAFLAHGQMQDVGTIGYNHAYVALQLIMLTALGSNLKSRQGSVMDVACLMMCVAGVFLSGSRAGMVAVLFYTVAFFARKPESFLTAVTLIGLLALVGVGVVSGSGIDVGQAMDRQSTLSHPFDRENLSGREDIWQESVDFINTNPVRWIVGAGPGSVGDQRINNAHMLYLHLVMETGVLGLIAFLYGMFRITSLLRRYERGIQSIFLVTLAFLISSFTQETFYPVPAFGHFLGLYLATLAIALRSAPMSNANVKGIVSGTRDKNKEGYN